MLSPFYQDSLSAYENLALQQCFKILSSHTIIAIKPGQLTLPREAAKLPFTKIISFDDKYFDGIEGYNALMLSADFYKAFLDFEYMLIYQLDAFVFKDELDYWCNRGFDYIGAPWMRDSDHPDLIKTVKSNLLYYFHTRWDLKKNGEPTFYQWENKVGNGGFSLRRVKKFYDLCLKHQTKIEGYLKQANIHYNEDRFWSIEVNRKSRVINIPDYKIGLRFSFECALERAYRHNYNQLPFGCHAWHRHLWFWRPLFKSLGYEI